MKKKIIAVVSMSLLVVMVITFFLLRGATGTAVKARALQAGSNSKNTSGGAGLVSSSPTKAVKKPDLPSKHKTGKRVKKPKVKINTANQKVAYLTFDDGPSELTPHLLDILKKYNVKASFFVIAASEDTAQKRAWMKREVNEGHTIGLHSWSHDYSYIYSSESNFLTDFSKMKNMIKEATGVTPKFCRFPGGTNNTVSLDYHYHVPIMSKLLADVENQGMTAVDWNAGAIDAVNHVPSKGTIVNAVVNQCKYLKKAIILLHDSSPHSSSVEAVPEIIKKLRAMGFTFEPLTSSKQAITFNPS